ncbi:MAG: hypothetical protein R3A51_02695 [Nannocystaceae bacterium]|nr:hypothetical protein [Myxococcales bacterium]
MSNRAFEVLLEVSRALEDDFIDEDHSEVSIGAGEHAHEVPNRTITVRGRREGQAILIFFQDYHEESFSAVSFKSFERDILEIFVAQPRVAFEGRCRHRALWDRLASLVGRGGLSGAHALYERHRVDGEGPPLEGRFADALVDLMGLGLVRRIVLQAASGLTLVLHWRGETDANHLLGVIDRVRAAASTLEG